ncbi:hypothetical protein DVH05_026107 [Phytophthora capsici]|nr:hypothetical protein DVH05_026107 [Phytophthora capsici]
MERVTRKRKAQEMAESSSFVVERINELNAVLVERDVLLVDEIKEQRDEIGKLKKQLVDANEECLRWKGTAEFRHPDAVIDRIRTKLWHHGDLSILRKAIDPQTRVLRNMEGRGDRSLYVCDSAPKKASTKAPTADGHTPAMSPKNEYEEKEPAPIPTEPVPAPIPTEPVPAPLTDPLEEVEGQQVQLEEEDDEEEKVEGTQQLEEEEAKKQQQADEGKEEEDDGSVNVSLPSPEAQKNPLNDTTTSSFNSMSGMPMLTSGAS